MICIYTVKKFCKEDPSMIENYDKAIADKTQTWDCHKFKEHYGITCNDNANLYGIEYNWYRNHNHKCRWEVKKE